MNVVDALIQEDALHGQHLDNNGLEKIRVKILRIHQPDGWDDSLSETVGNPDYETETPSLFSGAVLEQHDDADSPFGLREPPLG